MWHKFLVGFDLPGGHVFVSLLLLASAGLTDYIGLREFSKALLGAGLLQLGRSMEKPTRMYSKGPEEEEGGPDRKTEQ